MKSAPLRVWICALLLAVFNQFAPAAIVPLSSTVTFNLFGNDYSGPFAGIPRNPATVGPMPIAQFPLITDSGILVDPSPAAQAVAQSNITYGSTGTNEFVLTAGVLIQPTGGHSLSELRIDFTAAYVSLGATPAHTTNLSYILQLEVYPLSDPTDPPPYALFDSILVPAINGIPAPDGGLLLHLQLGPTNGPMTVTVPGPDGSMSVPSLNDGDILTVTGQLSFKVSNGAFTPLPEPATCRIIGAIGIPFLLSRRRSVSR